MWDLTPATASGVRSGGVRVLPKRARSGYQEGAEGNGGKDDHRPVVDLLLAGSAAAWGVVLVIAPAWSALVIVATAALFPSRGLTARWPFGRLVAIEIAAARSLVLVVGSPLDPADGALLVVERAATRDVVLVTTARSIVIVTTARNIVIVAAACRWGISIVGGWFATARRLVALARLGAGDATYAAWPVILIALVPGINHTHHSCSCVSGSGSPPLASGTPLASGYRRQPPRTGAP
jgi:hypothetical protein